jgi:hypothetical protein
VICRSGFGLHPDQAGKLQDGFPGGSGFPAAISPFSWLNKSRLESRSHKNISNAFCFSRSGLCADPNWRAPAFAYASPRQAESRPTMISFLNSAQRDVVSLLIYEFNFGIYSSCRAKPEYIRSAGG